jgi:hypothetical protein
MSVNAVPDTLVRTTKLLTNCALGTFKYILSFPLITSALMVSGTPRALLMILATPLSVLFGALGTVTVKNTVLLILIENVSPALSTGLKAVPVTTG